MALGLDVLNTLHVGDEPLLVARLKVTRSGGLDGLAMRDLARGPGSWPSAGRSARATWSIRRAAAPGCAGDEAYLIGPYEELLAVFRRDRPTPGLGPPRAPDSPVISSE